jgi:leucyl/phenylalanyl-tRNA--protein transferase
MFHRFADASKAGLAFLTQHLRSRGYELLDVQWTNTHTRRLGAIDLPRGEYLARLAIAVQRSVTFRD